MSVALTALSSRNLALTLVVISVSLTGWFDLAPLPVPEAVAPAVLDFFSYVSTLSRDCAVFAASISMLFFTDLTPLTWRASVTARDAFDFDAALPVRLTTPS